MKYLLSVRQKGGKRERRKKAVRVVVRAARVAIAGGVEGNRRADLGGGV